MLKDLTKDMLYDMDIKTMGDVIAILRQAKEVIEENTKIQLLGNESLVNNLVNTKARLIANNNTATKLNQPLKRSITETTQSTNVDSKAKRIVTTTSSIDKNSKIMVPTKSTIQRKVTFPTTQAKSSSIISLKANQFKDLSKVSVFERLGGGVNESKVNSNRSNQFRKATLVSDKRAVNIKDRLGTKGVKASNSRIVNTNPSKQVKVNSKSQSNRIKKLSLKKSIFDRLGPIAL